MAHKPNTKVENQERVNILKKSLKEMKKDKDVRGVLRTKALIAYYKGNPLEIVAQCYDVSAKSLQRWIKRFEKSGNVKDRPRSGRQPKLSPAEAQEMKKIIIEQKERVWFAKHIHELLVTLFGVCYSVKYIPDLLRSMGLSFQKLKHVLVCKSRKKRMKWLKETLPTLFEKQLKEGWRIFYQDEVGFQTNGTLAYSWGEKGEQTVVRNYGRRGRVNLIGAMELGTGLFHGVLTSFSVNATRFRRFLCHLKREMPDDKLILICDNARFHHAKWLSAWGEQQQSWLQLAFLPAYSPDFNPIERLWRWMKAEYTHNRCWKSKAELRTHLKQMLTELPDRVGEYKGVMNKEHRRRTHFFKHYIDRQIAQLLGVSINKVKGWWRYALRQWRAERSANNWLSSEKSKEKLRVNLGYGNAGVGEKLPEDSKGKLGLRQYNLLWEVV